MGDLDGFPAVPRRPRAGAWLRRNTPLGVAAVLLVASTLLISVWVLLEGRDLLPLADDALDASSARADATVTGAARDGTLGGGGHRVSFRFAAGDEAVDGVSFLPPGAPAPAVGSQVSVQYLPHEPTIARVAGSHRMPPWSPYAWWLRFLGLPGLFALGVYLRGAFQQRLLLTYGRLTLARVVAQTPLLLAYPPQRRVTFEFEDENRRTHRNSHWIGLHTPLGARLESNVSTLPVIHDADRPRSSRLSHRSDFRT